MPGFITTQPILNQLGKPLGGLGPEGQTDLDCSPVLDLLSSSGFAVRFWEDQNYSTFPAHPSLHFLPHELLEKEVLWCAKHLVLGKQLLTGSYVPH
jgi:hypothetical protein